MGDESLIVLGKVFSVHGIRGELKVYSFTDPIDNILQYKEWMLRHEQRILPVSLEKGRIQGKVLVVSLNGLDDRDQALTYVGTEVCIPRSQLPELPSDEYYWHQLQGLHVINKQDQLLGVVSHLLETGANDVLVVKPCANSVDNKEHLLPYIDQCVLSIDLEKEEIKVDWDAEF